MSPEQVLALMLALTPRPGVSTYSVVPVAQTAPAPCSEPYDPRCKAPWFSPRHKSHVRVETRAEGMVRYARIARAISKFSKADADLARVVITITRYESGWRRDIHSGIGTYAIGDNGWSWCLGQLMRKSTDPTLVYSTYVPGKGSATVTYKGAIVRSRDLVGVGERPTNICIAMVTKKARRALEACRKWNSHERCPFAVYGGLNPSTGHKGIFKRGKTYRGLQTMTPPTLPEDAKVHRDTKPENVIKGGTQTAAFKP